MGPWPLPSRESSWRRSDGLWCLRCEVVEKATKDQADRVRTVRKGRTVVGPGVMEPKKRITNFREGGELEMM